MNDKRSKNSGATTAPLGSIQTLLAVHLFEPMRIEQDRLMMVYEDQLSHMTRRVGQLQEKCDKWKRYLRKTKDDYDQLQSKMIQIQQKHKSSSSSRQRSSSSRPPSSEVTNNTDKKEGVEGEYPLENKKKMVPLRSPLPLPLTNAHPSVPSEALEIPLSTTSTTPTYSGEKRKVSAILIDESTSYNKHKPTHKHSNFDVATHLEFPESSIASDNPLFHASKENVSHSTSNSNNSNSNSNNNNSRSHHAYTSHATTTHKTKPSPTSSSRSLQLTTKTPTSSTTMPPPVGKPSNHSHPLHIDIDHPISIPKKDTSTHHQHMIPSNHRSQHHLTSTSSGSDLNSRPNHAAHSNDNNINLISTSNTTDKKDHPNDNDNPKPSDPEKSKYIPKYIDVVRNKAARAALPGHTCRDCAAFYDAMVEQGIVNDANRAMFLQSCSRHKAQWAMPDTPDSFWDISVNTPAAWK